jgi:transposase
MDNCSIHHDEEIRRLIEDECGMYLTILGSLIYLTCVTGARLVYLPAYSPDFNPIEEAFSFIKAWLRRHESLYTGSDQLPMLVHKAIHEITPEMSLGWFSDCGYLP